MTDTNLVARPVTRGPKHHFFGYYGICPWDATGQYLLCLESDFHERPPAPERLITFNHRQDERYVAVVLDIHTGQKRILPYPVSAMSRDGAQALGLNYARLKSLRPVVGYAGLPDPFADQNCPAEDGVYTTATKTGEARVLLS